ncbi:MAG: hypothetical protein ACI93R_002355 [Flavobacteriales bacterium]|jgi:hypothetical protein
MGSLPFASLLVIFIGFPRFLYLVLLMLQDGLHRSPGLTAIANHIQNKPNNHILDLGECIPKNFQFFSPLGCRFRFEGFYDAIENAEFGVDDSWLNDFLSDLPKEQKFDIVLAWDLFNFLSPEQLYSVYRKLESVLKPNTIIYMLSYVGAMRPSQPSGFSIENKYYIKVTLVPETKKNTLRLTTAQTLKSLPKFFMLRSYTSQPGMLAGISEQILSYRPEEKTRETSFSNAEMSAEIADVDVKFRSPSIEFLNVLSHENDVQSLLDLGVKNSTNDESWKTIAQDVYSTDIHLVLRRLKAMSQKDRSDYLMNGQFLSFKESQTFDVIIVWDLFNYLDESQLLEFGRRIVKYSHDGTRLMSMLYSGDNLPVNPRKFVLVGENLGLRKRDFQDLKPRELTSVSSLKLQRALPGYYVEKTFSVGSKMLKGMCEYVFIFKGQETLDREKKIMTAEVMARRKVREEAAKQAS